MKAILLLGLCVAIFSFVFSEKLPDLENVEENVQKVDKTMISDFPNEQSVALSETRKANDKLPNNDEPGDVKSEDEMARNNLESNSPIQSFDNPDAKAREDDLSPKLHRVDDDDKPSANDDDTKKARLLEVLDDWQNAKDKRHVIKHLKEIHRCSLPLGMENGRIRDAAITASSYAALPGFRASQSRLNTVSVGSAGYGAWVAAKNDGKQWLKIDLGEVARVTRVATQGREDANQWTSTYSLSYSIDGVNWAYYKTDSIVKVFTGNSDRNSIVAHNLAPFIEARFVRFNVLTAISRPALRVELYGCRTVHSCAEAVGIEDGRIPDSAMSSSSALSSAFTPKEARLNMQRYAWIPKVQNTAQYLRIDLVKIYSLTRVATQGRYNVDQYVRRYTLSSSFDGSHYIYYKPNGYTVKTFSANNNGNTPVSHLLNPRIEARIIQFNPVAWQSYIAMRVEVYGCPSKLKCRLPLGIQDGRIMNGQLTGTSATAIYARLYGSSAFTAGANNVNQFVQVDFVRVVKVTGIATQGRPTATQYVKTYSVSYSVDGSNWAYVRRQSQIKVFSGNNDRNTVIRNDFRRPLFARFVKIHPKSWVSHIALRMELYGCEADGLCSKPLGLEDGRLENQFMTASSFYNGHYQPQYGRLNNVAVGSNKGSWLAKVNNGHQYLQVDLGRQNVITKVAIQGRYEGANFVRSFTLSYSQDGSHWTFYRLATGNIKVFGGVADQQTIRFNYVSPSIIAKFVRIHPKAWQGHIGMRMELYGCYLVNTCMMPLGVEDRRIPDGAMSASSVHSVKFAAKYGRLNVKKTGTNFGGWCSRTANAKEWFQIQLNNPTVITKIAIQGREDAAQWITSFKLQFSYNGAHFADYKVDGRTVIFPGNFDPNTIQAYHLHPNIYGKFIRIRPLTWHGFTCLRAEIHGCNAKGLGHMVITT